MFSKNTYNGSVKDATVMNKNQTQSMLQAETVSNGSVKDATVMKP